MKYQQCKESIAKQILYSKQGTWYDSMSDKNFGVKLEGENHGCFYIKVLNEIRKKDSIYVWFETQNEDGTLVMNRIPHYYLAGLDKDTIYLNKNVNTGAFLNVYVTYEY